MTKPNPFNHKSQAPTSYLEADQNSFNQWKTRRNLLITLYTIDPAAREKYKTNLLLSSVSPVTQAIVNARLDDSASSYTTANQKG